MKDYKFRDSFPQKNSLAWRELLSIEDELFVNRKVAYFDWTLYERQCLYEEFIQKWVDEK